VPGPVPQLAAVPLALSDTALKVIRKLKTTNGRLHLQPDQRRLGTDDRRPSRHDLRRAVLGVAVHAHDGHAANTKWVICGDFNYFEIFDRTGITSMVDPYSAAATHQSTLYVYTRTDSHIMLPEAFSAIFY
jgi:HK97 family phage major capsid protein